MSKLRSEDFEKKIYLSRDRFKGQQSYNSYLCDSRQLCRKIRVNNEEKGYCVIDVYGKQVTPSVYAGGLVAYAIPQMERKVMKGTEMRKSELIERI